MLLFHNRAVVIGLSGSVHALDLVDHVVTHWGLLAEANSSGRLRIVALGTGWRRCHLLLCLPLGKI